MANYQNVNSIANQVAQTPFQQYSTDPNAFVAPLTATQQAGILGTNQYSNEAQPFYQQASNLSNASTTAAQSGLGAAQGATSAATAPITQSQITQYENPYESQVIAPTEQALNQQYAQAQSGALGNAIQNGAFGGDRAAVSAANLQQQQALGYGQVVGGLLNQNYSQALGEANTEQQVGLQGANQYGQLASQYGQLGQANATNQANYGAGAQAAGLSGAQAQLTAGQAQQQTEQAGETALYNQFLQQQSYPFQTTQFLGNIAEGTGALSGSTTTANQPAPFFSDERLKEDMQPVGKTFDGLNIYKFRYKGDKQTHVGLSAQDVERKHPDAVGLAGGYKTVDYDAATNEAAHKGRAHQGGLVLPFRRQDGSVVPERKHYDVGGYAGLSPNAAWAAGFNLDPSYLQAQQAAYGNAPWGNAGPVSGASPYGGKSHVPPSTGSPHAALAVAHAPQQQSQNQLQQLASGVNQLEGLGKVGKSLFNDVKQNVPGLAPPASAPVAPAAPQAQLPPDHAPMPSGTGSPIAPSNNASAGLMASVDPSDLNTADDLGLAFSRRGGRIQRDAGGATYQDATTDDESAGGDVPYDSGTGSGGLDIPDDKPHNSLATSQPPSQSNSGNGLGNVLGDVADIGKVLIPFLNRGGRVGLAGGGDPDAAPQNQQQQQVAPDMGSQPHQTQPGEVLPQDGLGGIGDTLNRNQGLIVPILHGLGTMASSNSRYLGSAILQGLGGAADSYEQTQNEMQGRAGNQPIITQRQNEASQSDLDLYQSMIAQRPELQGMSFPQFEALKASGKLNSIGGGAGSGALGANRGPQAGAGDANGPFAFTPQERMTRKLANGNMAYADPAYNAGYAAKMAIVRSPSVQQTVMQANHDAAQQNANGFTTDAQGNRVPVPGFGSTALAQNHPNVMAQQAQAFQDQGTNYMKEYGRSMSLFDELGDVYHQFQAGPTADWRASVARLANEFDPQGNYPFLHGIPAGNDAANYDKARKDIAQLTASQLNSMPGGAPAHSTDLLGHFAADPHLSPDALRDIVVRGKANLQQQADYYQGFDPFSSGAQGVMAYTKDFYKAHPFDQYRQQFDKTTPSFAGQQSGQGQPAPVAAQPNDQHVQMLRAHPELAPQFDAKFGPGASKRILSQ